MIPKVLQFTKKATICVLLATATVAQALTVGISSLGALQFNGADDTFTFTAGTGGRDFEITAVTGPEVPGGLSLASMGLTGKIDGTFQIGDIAIDGDEQTAAVTLAPASAPGLFTIWDAANVMLTASVQWLQIKTEAASGEINTAGGMLNLTNIQYTGTNDHLRALTDFGAGNGSAVVTFQFNPAQSLTTLTEMTGTLSTEYKGALTATVPDGGATAALLGTSLLSVGYLFRRMKRA